MSLCESNTVISCVNSDFSIYAYRPPWKDLMIPQLGWWHTIFLLHMFGCVHQSSLSLIALGCQHFTGMSLVVSCGACVLCCSDNIIRFR